MTSVLWAEVSPGPSLNKRQSERMIHMHTNTKTTTIAYRALMNWGLSWGNSGDAHLYGKRELISLLERQGFVLRRWRRVNIKSFVLRAEKP